MSVVLKAELRENLGKSASRKIKRSGRIPAVIYYPEGNVNFSLSSKEFEHEYFKGNALSSVVEIELDGKKIQAIAHKVELDPVSDRPVHVDFFDCKKSEVIRAKPKVAYINQDKSPGIKRGGFLHITKRRVEVLCENANSVPNVIEVDIAPLHLGTKLRADLLKLPAGVKLARKDNFLLGSILGRGKSDDAADAAKAAANEKK